MIKRVKFLQKCKFAIAGTDVREFEKGDERNLRDSDAEVAIKGGFAEIITSESVETPEQSTSKEETTKGKKGKKSKAENAKAELGGAPENK